MPHSPNCAALKWFEPLAKTEDAEIAVTRLQSWTGDTLGPRWKQVSDDSARRSSGRSLTPDASTRKEEERRRRKKKKNEGRRMNHVVHFFLLLSSFLLLPSSFFLLSSSVFLLSSVFLSSASLTAAAHSAPVPSEVHASLTPILKAGGVRAVVDGVTLDFWWVAGVADLRQRRRGLGGRSRGVARRRGRIGGTFRDIRGKRHQARRLHPSLRGPAGQRRSPRRFTASPVPPDQSRGDDRNPAPQGHEGTIELSKGAIGGSHPGVWSIDPPAAGRKQSSRCTRTTWATGGDRGGARGP